MIPPVVADLPLWAATQIKVLPRLCYERVRTPPPSVSVDTSEMASDAIKPHANAIRARVLKFVTARGSYGATADEISHTLALDGSTVRPRLVELESIYAVHKSDDKRPTRSGRMAIVYRAGAR